MQIVIDFLLEYYVWVLVILGILLITVIGFLADSKKKKKMRDKVNNENTDVNLNNMNQYPDFNNMNMNGSDLNMNNGFNMSSNLNNNMLGGDFNTAVPDNNLNNNFNMMNQNVNGMQNNDINMMNQGTNNMSGVSMMNQNINSMPSQNVNNFTNEVNQGMNNFNSNMNMGVNNTTPVNNNGSDTAFFVPASEQTPKFEPREVVIPKPVEATPIMNDSTNVVNSWENPVPTANNTVNQVAEPTIPVMPTPEVNVNASSQVQGTIPTPVEVPRPVNTIPNAQVSEQNINVGGIPVQQMPVGPIPNVNPTAPAMNVQPNMPNLNTSTLESQPVMPNVTPSQPMNNYNTATLNQTNSGVNNPNIVAGGANFVVGTPGVQNNQVPNNDGNSNWNL